jgi:hypothetical protein
MYRKHFWHNLLGGRTDKNQVKLFRTAGIWVEIRT